MKIRFMWKDSGSNTGNCPAMYEAPGGYVVQGKLLDAETRAQLRDLGASEDRRVRSRERHRPHPGHGLT